MSIDNSRDDQFYWCTKHKCIPNDEVLNAILEYSSNDEIYHLDKLYDYLRNRFKVQTFNRKNLKIFLEPYAKITKSGHVVLRDKSLKLALKSTVRDIYHKVFELSTSRVFTIKNINDDTSTIIQSFSNQFAINNSLTKEVSYKIMLKIISDFSMKVQRNELILNFSNFELFFKENTSLIEQYTKFHKAIDNLLESNLQLQIERLFDSNIVAELHSKNIYTLRNLKDKLDLNISRILNYNFDLNIELLKALNVDAKDVLEKLGLNFISKKEDLKVFEILTGRCQGLTLEELGEKFDLTRERIRQIEKKAIERFIEHTQFINGLIFFRILKVQVKNIAFIPFAEIYEIFGQYTEAMLLGLEELSKFDNAKDQVIYSKEYKFINLSGNNWSESLLIKCGSLDVTLDEEKINNFCERYNLELQSDGIFLDISNVTKIVKSEFIKSGNVYTRSRMNIGKQYSIIVDKYYENGINVYSEPELKVFRKFYSREFNDQEIFNKADRAISARLTDALVQIDRGKYNLEYKVAKLNDSLAKEIKRYIDEGPSVVLSLQIFNKFEDILKRSGIDNRYMLHSMLRRKFENKYYFKRDFISKTGENYRIIDEFEALLARKHSIFSIDDLFEQFPSVGNMFVQTYLSNHDEYISVFEKKWIHVRDLKISKNDQEVLENLINTLLSKNSIITSTHVLEATRLKIPDFYSQNGIEYQYYLFGILKYIFKDKYNFSRPFISSIGTSILGVRERMIQFIYEQESVRITDLKKFISTHKLTVYSMQEFIKSINDQYLRVDEDLLRSNESLSIKEDTVEMIDLILENVLKSRVGVNVKKINTQILPKIGIAWNHYLLASVIERYSNSFNIIYSTGFYHTAEFYVVFKNLDIVNYDELIEKGVLA